MRRRLATLLLLAACAPARGAAPGAGPRATLLRQTPFVDSAAHRVLHLGVAPGVRLEVLDWGGTGPALLLLAGMQNSGHSYDGFAARFTDHFHVLAITRRGLGDSPAPASVAFDTRTLAGDVRSVLDSLGIARAVVVGHSYGGSEAAWFATLFPERTAAVVFLDSYCSSCPGVPPAARAYRPPGPPLTDRDTLSAAGMVAFQRRTLGFAFAEADLRTINRYGADGSVRDPVPREVRRAIATGSSHPGYAGIRAPVLAIFAERATVEQEFWWAGHMDRNQRTLAQVYVETNAANRRVAREVLAQALPSARIELIPGAQHYLFLSHPAETERLLRDFLASVDY